MNILKLHSELTSDEKNIIHNHLQNSKFQICKFLHDTFQIDITNDADIVSSFERDWSNMPGEADYVTRPINRKQCAIILYTCNRLKIPITISAGKTNLTGSATPNGGLILSVINMKSPNPIINQDNKTVKASVGIVLEDLRKEIISSSNQKLYYPVDPTSREDALIGGIISCNASGFIPGDKGATRYWVEGLYVLLPNGYGKYIQRGEYTSDKSQFILQCDEETININIPDYNRPRIKNASGPFTSSDSEIDFIDLIVGSEGIFCLITEVKLRVAELPKGFLDLFITLPSEKNAIKFRGYLEQKDILYNLTALEYFGYNCQNYMQHKEKLFKDDSSVGIYLQYPLIDQPIEESIEEWAELINHSKCGITDEDVFLLNSPENWRIFFEARHSMPVKALEKTKELDAVSMITDTIVPYDNFNNFVHFTHQLLKENKIEYLLFGHLGDCHLHFHVIYTKEETTIINDLYRKIIQKSAELNGVYSAEHGTGKRKTIDFLECYGEDAVEQVRQCKLSFDPNNILNTGNIITIKDI